jgi:hypothetical protein
MAGGAYLLVAIVVGIILATTRPPDPFNDPGYVATKVVLGALLWPVLLIGRLIYHASRGR